MSSFVAILHHLFGVPDPKATDLSVTPQNQVIRMPDKTEDE